MDRDTPLELMGAAEVADYLGVTRQRVNQLASAGQMPPPVAHLEAGRIWLRDEVEDWARRSGRQR